MLQFEYVFIHVTATNAAVDFDLHVVTECQANFLGLLGQLSGWGEDQDLRLSQLKVHALQSANREHPCLSGTALALYDHIPLLSDGQDCPLLDRAWLVKPVRVYSSKQLLAQGDVIEALDDLEVLTGLNDHVRVLLERLGLLLHLHLHLLLARLA